MRFAYSGGGQGLNSGMLIEGHTDLCVVQETGTAVR